MSSILELSEQEQIDAAFYNGTSKNDLKKLIIDSPYRQVKMMARSNLVSIELEESKEILNNTSYYSLGLFFGNEEDRIELAKSDIPEWMQTELATDFSLLVQLALIKSDYLLVSTLSELKNSQFMIISLKIERFLELRKRGESFSSFRNRKLEELGFEK